MSQGIPCQETKVPEFGRLTSPLRAVPCQLNSPAGPRSPEVESLCGSALVSMVKPADFRHGDNPAQFRRFNRSSVWTVLPKRKMTTRAVIIVQVAGDLPPERGLIHHDDVIQAFAANGTDQPFDIWALPGRAGAVSTSVICISAANVRKVSP